MQQRSFTLGSSNIGVTGKPTDMQSTIFNTCTAALVVMLTFAGASVNAAAPGDDPRDLALLKRMTLPEKVNQLIMFGQGAATGPDNAGRPHDKTLDEFVPEGIRSG